LFEILNFDSNKKFANTLLETSSKKFIGDKNINLKINQEEADKLN
jgi:hypothetical protein